MTVEGQNAQSKACASDCLCFFVFLCGSYRPIHDKSNLHLSFTHQGCFSHPGRVEFNHQGTSTKNAAGVFCLRLSTAPAIQLCCQLLLCVSSLLSPSKNLLPASKPDLCRYTHIKVAFKNTSL